MVVTEELLVRRLDWILNRIEPVPEEWKEKTVNDAGQAELKPLLCESYAELIKVWKRAMYWTDGLDRALSVMLASIAAIPTVGDQLWVKILGPASIGKSALCAAVSVNRKYVLAKSTIRGFHSGFGDGTEDNSLIAQIGGKALVTKDGDTLLTSPNLPQILSEARDVYDGDSRTHYRNKNSREYSGVRMAWILCGTASLRSLDSSELGERFLDCVIMDGIDEEMEDLVLLQVASRTDRNMSQDALGESGSQHDPDMAEAIQRTGGYIDWLRDNVVESMPITQASPLALRRCIDLGKFVAFMRARPSAQQDETAEREFAARLVIQLVRLSKCLAFVLNRQVLDTEVLRRTARVALDTARGQTLDIVDHLYDLGDDGGDLHSVILHVGQDEVKAKVLLRFLRAIKVLETFIPDGPAGIRMRPRWRIVGTVARLYERVMEIEVE